MDAKLLFVVSLFLVGLLCYDGEANENNLDNQNYRNLCNESVDTDLNVPLTKYLKFNQLYWRFQILWKKIRNDYFRGLNSRNVDTYPFMVKYTRYPEVVGNIKTNVLKRRRRSDNLSSTPSTTPSTPVISTDQSTSVFSIDLSQPENISAMSNISLPSSVSTTQNYTSASNNNISVPVNSSSSITLPVSENPRYDSTTVKSLPSQNESVTFSDKKSTKISQDDLYNDHALQNDTNGVKIDKMVDGNTKTAIPPASGGISLLWFILVSFCGVSILLGFFLVVNTTSLFRPRSNRAHYEVRREEVQTQV